jgi:uncharacterized alkaline shock family protein YloU
VNVPVPGKPPGSDPPGDADPITGLQGSGSPPAPSSDREEVDAILVVPAEAPVPVDVPAAVAGVVPVRADATDAWSGKVIDPVPTTVDDIAALVLAVPDVVRLHAGRFGEVATYLPGRRVTGIKLGDDTVEVHVVVAGGVPIRQTAQLIHAAVATRVATPVHVYVEDVAVA